MNTAEFIDTPMAQKEFEVEERDLYLTELSNAKEAFITGTTKKIMPVRQIDELTIGDGRPGPLTIELQKMYEAYISRFLKQQTKS